jgi:hypothetical protein
MMHWNFWILTKNGKDKWEEKDKFKLNKECFQGKEQNIHLNRDNNWFKELLK